MVEYGVGSPSPVVPDPGRAVVEVVGVVGVVDAEAGTVRIDLTATCDGAQVLGKARALVRLPV